MDVLLILLVFGGGFIGAVTCMIFASRATDNLLRIIVLTAIALVLLFAQRSCWHVMDDLSGIGHGTSQPTIFGTLPTIALIICAFWAVTLVVSWYHERKAQPEDEHHDESP